MDAEKLISRGQRLFGGRESLLTLWQEIALNFYPERADFTDRRNIGTELAANLATSTPSRFRRDLGNAFGGMLRPTNKAWFHTRVQDYDRLSTESKAWLQFTEEQQRRAMYHRGTGFYRATKEADHDFAAFGQAVIQILTNRNRDNMLYRCWHLRDCAWAENSEGVIDCLYRRWSPHLVDLIRLFPKTVHRNTTDRAKKEPFDTTEIWHCVIPIEIYDGDKGYSKPFVSFYLDVANNHILEEINVDSLGYVVPRWQTVSGSQYAHSPAAVTALSDARTLQEMTITLLEAGEKAVSPPMLGVREALRSDVNIMSGGITWVDREYDERLGEVLRPLTIDKNGIPLGMEMRNGLTIDLSDAFYLSKIQLPPAVEGMTAFETGERVSEYIRQALPLFEPVEMEYNAPTCDMTFEILMRHGVFGSITEMPRELAKREISFTFESPLHDAIERVKAQKYLEAISILANATAADPSTAYVMNHNKASRDALLSTGVPAAWLRSEGEVEDMAQADAEQQQAAMLLDQMQKGADVAKTVGLTPAPSGTQGGVVPGSI